MRTIDADALKADLKQYFTDGVLDGISARLAFNQILHDIDNAPTIEDLSEYSDKLWKKAYERGKAEARPQGEWIMNKTSARGRNYICTNCHNASITKFCYCGWCGAKMTKEAENE